MYNIPAPKSIYDQGYLSDVPRFVQFTTPILEPPKTASPTANLPLNILALIISYLDDISDVARVTRTSRLLYYMTLPQLYENVTLTSHSQIRYVNGRPEGFGGGSPFTMALNGLTTKNNVALVKSFRVKGELDEPGEEEYAKGRIPDGTVMLNTLLRIAVDRMPRLESFTWELTTKPMATLYQGLSLRPTLTSLTLRFPNSKTPRPTVVLPGMPNLRAFRVMDYDPLCYPDDVSLLIYDSRKLSDLRIHFSPRMRLQAEPTASFDTFFGRCFAAGYAPRVKHLAIQNFFGRKLEMMREIYDHKTATSACFLDTFGGARTGSATVYIDDTWRNLPDTLVSTQKTIRINEPAAQHVKMLENALVQLEHFYCVNDHPRIGSRAATPTSVVTPDPSPGHNHANSELVALGKDYLHVLTRKHGGSLKHLLMCDQWIYSQQEIGDIVRRCPNLTQLAVALDGPAFEVFRIIVQFLPNLVAVRIFDNDTFRQRREGLTHEERLLFMGRDFHRLQMRSIRYIGAGPEAFELLGEKEVTLIDGTTETIRDMVPLSPAEIEHVEVWGMDKLDIMLEPPVLDAAD